MRQFILYLMTKGTLPDNVLGAFTGDEEENCTGAKYLIKYLNSKNKKIKTIVVLDVTDMDWDEKADFTIENNFWIEIIGKRVIDIADQMHYMWIFVPENIDEIPEYIASDNVIFEAEEDESWFYDEKEQCCFSFCLPLKGEMYSNRDVLVLKKAFENYTDSLAILLNELA